MGGGGGGGPKGSGLNPSDYRFCCNFWLKKRKNPLFFFLLFFFFFFSKFKAPPPPNKNIPPLAHISQPTCFPEWWRAECSSAAFVPQQKFPAAGGSPTAQIRWFWNVEWAVERGKFLFIAPPRLTTLFQLTQPFAFCPSHHDDKNMGMHISETHTQLGEAFGFVCWFWVFYRFKEDGAVLLGLKHPWEH